MHYNNGQLSTDSSSADHLKISICAVYWSRRVPINASIVVLAMPTNVVT